MIVGFTGHRPDKINNEWDHSGPVSKLVRKEVKAQLVLLSPNEFICGLAQGGDMLAATAAIELSIPVTAALPFEGQEAGWSKEAKELREQILSHPLVTRRIISPGGPNTAKYHIRNRWIVDRLKGNEDRLIALWDHSPSGTGSTVKYALQKQKAIIYIDPRILVERTKSKSMGISV